MNKLTHEKADKLKNEIEEVKKNLKSIHELNIAYAKKTKTIRYTYLYFDNFPTHFKLPLSKGVELLNQCSIFWLKELNDLKKMYKEL